MSIHVSLSPEARVALQQQKRRSTVASVVVALLAMMLVGLILAIYLLPSLTQETPELVAYPSVQSPQVRPEAPKVQLPQAKPSAPAASVTKVIASATPSPMSLPTPDVPADTMSMDFGTDADFGQGWGLESSAEGGSSSGFGSTEAIAGGLRGALYDFKQDAKGKPVDDFNPQQTDPYAERVVRIQNSGFSESSFRRFFKAPQELSLTQIAIPLTGAEEGPRFFNAEEDIQPRGWLVHYQGQISSPRDITFRFVGGGDDYLAVYIDGRPRLHASRDSIQDKVRGRWEPARDAAGKYDSPIGGPKLVFGDWVQLKAGEAAKLDIGLGERPGGQVGFILMIEERGVDYRETPDGRPILPIFTTQPFSDRVREEITKGFPRYEFEWENVPIFPAAR